MKADRLLSAFIRDDSQNQNTISLNGRRSAACERAFGSGSDRTSAQTRRVSDGAVEAWAKME
jgi:hypothetical protein